MNNRYLSSAKIAALTEKVTAIASPADIKRLREIAKRQGFELTGNRRANIGGFWSGVCAKLQTEQRSGEFFKNRPDGDYSTRLLSTTVIHDYIKHLGLWSDYEFLSSDRWNALEAFANDLRFYGCDFSKGAAAFYEPGTSYAAFFQQFSKKHCNPSTVKQTDALREMILKLFKDCKTEADRYAIYNAVGLLAADPKMDEGEFHNATTTQP